MGRIISSPEHNTSGIVTVDRPVNPNAILRKELKQEQVEAGRLAVAVQEEKYAEVRVINPVE